MLLTPVHQIKLNYIFQLDGHRQYVLAGFLPLLFVDMPGQKAKVPLTYVSHLWVC